MQKTTRKSVCLAMIVRDEAPVIERCLLSILPFIDSWLIHDLGSKDSTSEIINTTLNELPGRVENHDLKSFADSRSLLLRSASESAELILMIDADEEFQTIEDSISMPPGVDIGIVNVVNRHSIVRQPRLFRSGGRYDFESPFGESLAHNTAPSSLITSFSLRHHADGIIHREPAGSFTKRLQIEAIVNRQPLSAATVLAFAQEELRRNNLKSCLNHLNEVIEAESASPEFWLASYIAAGIHQSKGNLAKATELFQACFESDPNRAEPLYRLAKLHQEHGDNSTALQLCKVALNLRPSTSADYIEPHIYEYAASLLAAECAAASGDHKELDQALKLITGIESCPANVAQRVTELRALTDKPTVAPAEMGNHSPDVKSQNTPHPKITVGMATHDDFDGVYFSVMSLVLYHKELLAQMEILIVDNNPESKHGHAVKSLCDRVAQARYVAAGEYQGTAVRERIFAEAKGELVLCMDCHVFLHAGALVKLLEYFSRNSDQPDLLHGPLYYDNHDHFSTHMKPEWNDGFFGRWGTDERGASEDAEPFDIPLQGMGLFACAKQHWPGFNHRFRGFGGEEGYIHEKFRQRGGRVLCLPFLRWTHRFDRPNAPSYTNRWEDRIRNYLIGWHELSMDRKPILEHFSKHLSKDVAAKANAEFLREQKGLLWNYDTVYLVCESDENWVKTKPILRRLAAENLVQRVTKRADLARLLTLAEARSLEDVVIIDSQTADRTNIINGIAALITDTNRDHCDIGVCINGKTTWHTADHADIQQADIWLIRKTAFHTASYIFANHASTDNNPVSAKH